jgi:hypothetical protein
MMFACWFGCCYICCSGILNGGYQIHLHLCDDFSVSPLPFTILIEEFVSVFICVMCVEHIILDTFFTVSSLFFACVSYAILYRDCIAFLISQLFLFVLRFNHYSVLDLRPFCGCSCLVCVLRIVRFHGLGITRNAVSVFCILFNIKSNLYILFCG